MRRRFLFGKNWFFEDTRKIDPKVESLWGVICRKDVYRGKSRFQSIEIFDTRDFGRVLVLDGLIQLSTRFEHIYHEMLVHPVMFSHPAPKRVLIVGGGDGGALRESLKHNPQEVVLVDIDKKVIDVCRRYLPDVSCGAFADKRVRVFNTDAVRFIKENKSAFDIIINDSTDLYGPSAALWAKAFYRDIRAALRKGGAASFQTAYFKEDFAARARKNLKDTFNYFRLHRAFIGCFPFDECTFSCVSQEMDLSRVGLKNLEKRFKGIKAPTLYYSPRMHLASTIIPGE